MADQSNILTVSQEAEELLRRYGLHRGEATHVNQIRGAVTEALNRSRPSEDVERLKWRKPTADELGHEDAAWIADGIGGQYSITPPKPVSGELLSSVDLSRCVEIDGQLHFKALLWWAHDEFSFVEFDSEQAAKQAAENDWQTRIRAALTSTNAPAGEDGERAKIVAWLRSGLSTSANDTLREIRAMRDQYLANAIERGDHLHDSREER